MSYNKNNIIAIIILSAVILLLSILCITLIQDKNNKENDEKNNTSHFNHTEISSEKSTNSTEKNTTSTTQNINVTESTTEKSENKLAQLIKNSGYSISDIEKQDIEQLVIITDNNNQTNAHLFSLNDGIWSDENITCKAYVGSAGIGNKQNDIDNITPRGLYTIGEAFYISTPPSTWLNTFIITENTYWITDVNSKMYNKRVESEKIKDENSAIHMIKSENNRYGCIINYNTKPVFPDKGSAIFMHCGTTPTNGSIALEEKNILKFLEILNSEKNPNILIF
ncbi:MAG: hypothetical protein UHK60_06320 [Acutalibacteraceae bacterium]|nr:hypothetical protein [Acutalibacteraceae bacterium]